MGKKTLNTVPCPICNGPVEGITVDEESISDAKTRAGITEIFETVTRMLLDQ